MYKFLSACLVGLASFNHVYSEEVSKDDLREVLEGIITDSDDLERVDDYLSWMSEFGRLMDVDMTNTDNLLERFEYWKETDDRIKAAQERDDLTWELGHTRFSDWSPTEKSGILLDESYVDSESRSAIESSNCKQVKLRDSTQDEDGEVSSLSKSTKSTRTYSYSVDNRAYDIAGIQDQGSCASCWDFSDVATLEVNRNLDYSLTTDDDTSSFVKLSEQYVLDCTDDGIGTCSGGYPIFTLMWVSENSGICASDDYTSYTEEEETCDTSACDKVDESVFTELYCLEDESDEQVSIAASTFGVEMAFKVYTSFYDYTSGVYSCDTSEEFLGWHAVTIVGVTDDYYMIKNSWSTDWGIDGYFKMDRDSFDDCKMSHFAWVSFNDLSNAMNTEKSVPLMDVSAVPDIRLETTFSKKMKLKSGSLESEKNIPGMDHIKLGGKTNINILIGLGIVVALSIVLCLIGSIYKSCRNCRRRSIQKLMDAKQLNEESALLDGYVAL